MTLHKITAVLLCILTLTSLISCKGEEYKKVIDKNLDPSLFVPNDIIQEAGNHFVNAPGMVLYMSQDDGAILSYINKSTNKSHIFCFDSLCIHENCIARRFHMATNIIYCNNYLYSIKPESSLGGGGNSIYQIDLTASKAKKIYESDGNELFDIFSYENYIFFKEQKQQGNYSIIRYDTGSGKMAFMGQQGNKDFADLLISGSTIMVLFADDIYYYKTNSDFSEFIKINYFTTADISWKYISDGKMYANSDSIDGVYYTPDKYRRNDINVVFYSIDICTGERKNIYINKDKWMVMCGMGEGYIYYYTMEEKDVNDVIKLLPTPELYRVNINSGESEKIFTFTYNENLATPFNIIQMLAIEGEIYCHWTEKYNDSSSKYMHGILKKNANNFWEMSISQPLLNN